MARAAPAEDQSSADRPTDSPADRARDPGADERPSTGRGGDRPSGPDLRAGPGRLIAALLLVALVFLSGVVVGRSGVDGEAPRGAGGTSARTSSPAAAVTSSPRPTETASPSGPAPRMPRGSGAASPPATTASPASPIPVPTGPVDLSLLEEAIEIVRRHYVDRSVLGDRNLLYGAISGMVDALGDPGHSVFMTPEDLASAESALSGEIEGIGVILGERNGSPVIVSVISDSPAARAGLRAGDVLVSVDDKRVDTLTSEEIARRVRGPAGTEVRLRLLHRGSREPYDVTITRARIEVPTVMWAFVPDSRIADIRLVQFSQGLGEQLREAVSSALDQGATGIVLDLRSNPGGYVAEAVAAASEFLPEGTVVFHSQDADGNRKTFRVQEAGRVTEIPLAVLVDFGTVSSAEIVAGAIKDAGRAPVIGTRTFGTGTVLLTYKLSDGSAIRLGVEQWLTPSGQRIFQEGIEPTEEVELAPDAYPLEPDELRTMTREEVERSGDAQLLRAIEILEEGGD